MVGHLYEYRMEVYRMIRRIFDGELWERDQEDAQEIDGGMTFWRKLRILGVKNWVAEGQMGLASGG